ncbi:hypothetical protein D3C84_1197030 [compost metagenome]
MVIGVVVLAIDAVGELGRKIPAVRLEIAVGDDGAQRVVVLAGIGQVIAIVITGR